MNEKSGRPRLELVLLLGLACFASAVAAKPVFVAETPGHTLFYIDDKTVHDFSSRDGAIRQVVVSTRNAIDSSLVSGQVAADGLMQFRCKAKTYREVSTTAIYKDGSRHMVVPPSPTRPFSPTQEGRFERKLLDAACRFEVAQP